MTVASPPLRWRQVLGYGLGDAANNFSFALGLLFLLHYYTDIAGIPAAAAGTLLLAVRIYDAFMDLLAGRIIDRWRGHGRWGRLRPWLLFGGVPVLALNVAVFSVPAGLSVGQKIAYATLTYALLGTAYAFVSIAYGSLAGVMTQSPTARARLGAARSWMSGATFFVLAIVVSRGVLGGDVDTMQARLTTLTLVLFVAGVLLYGSCFLTAREAVPRRAEALHWRDCVPVLRDNAPLQRLCLTTFATLASSGCASASGIFFAQYVLGNASLFPSMVIASSLAGLGLAVPLAPWVAARLGRARAFQAGMLLAAAGHAALWWVPAGNVAAVLACMATAAAGSSLGMALLWALEADTVEYGEWRHGLRLEGLNYALFSLTRKCGLAIGAALPAFLLAGSDYVPNLAEQGALARQVLRQAMSVLPACGFGLAALLMLRYPLTDRHYLAALGDMRTRGATDSGGS